LNYTEAKAMILACRVDVVPESKMINSSIYATRKEIPLGTCTNP